MSTSVTRKSFLAGMGMLAASSLTPRVACADEVGWTLGSVTWQDPENVMVMWSPQGGAGTSYEVYRAQQDNTDFELVGTTAETSFRDSDVAWPETPIYRVCAVTAGERSWSSPMAAGTNERPLSKVTVLMYHNFITQEDIASGVEFEEYSLDPSDFEEDLLYFYNHGYTTITSADVLAYIRGEKPLPKKALIISIDDGTWGVYKNAWPLLLKYGAHADFNLIGENIDGTWDYVHGGGSRVGDPAPYCVWEELVEMRASGAVNLCSHTYYLHRYNRDGRIGASMMDGETVEEYSAVVAEDYRLSCSCIGGWTGTNPTTMAYPYSRRSSTTDAAILASTGYEILMGGEAARGTSANYYVDGAAAESQMRIMSRPCRMEGHPASEYLQAVDEDDAGNGVNVPEDYRLLSDEEAASIARWYLPFEDVPGGEWYAGPVYYAYLNSLLLGSSATRFDPLIKTSRATLVTVLYRLEGSPEVGGEVSLPDVEAGSWYWAPMAWAAENGVLMGGAGGLLQPNRAVTREEAAIILQRYAERIGMRLPGDGDLSIYADASLVSDFATESMRWAVRNGFFLGSGGNINPRGGLTRAELAAVIMRFVRMAVTEGAPGLS